MTYYNENLLCANSDILGRHVDDIKEARAEAIKEFAEQLKKYYRHIDKTAGALIEYTIDQKVKEFLEGGADDA